MNINMSSLARFDVILAESCEWSGLRLNCSLPILTIYIIVITVQLSTEWPFYYYCGFYFMHECRLFPAQNQEICYGRDEVKEKNNLPLSWNE